MVAAKIGSSERVMRSFRELAARVDRWPIAAPSGQLEFFVERLLDTGTAN